MKVQKKVLLLVIIWILVVISYFFSYNLKEKSKKINEIKIEKQSSLENKKNIKEKKYTVYLPDEKLVTMNKVTKELPYYSDRRKEINCVFEEVKQGLLERKILSNSEMEIKNIFFDKDTVYLNMSKEIEELGENDKKSIFGIYSIVNTLTELRNIKKIKFLVDGEEKKGIFYQSYTKNTKI